MTLDEIGRSLPNGFHDADLTAFAVDLTAKTLMLELEVDLSSPHRNLEPSEPHSRKIRVTVSGLEYFRLDPPDLGNRYSLSDSDIETGTVDEHPTAIPADIRRNIPSDCFAHWFFLRSWNSFLVLAGRDAAYIDLKD